MKKRDWRRTVWLISLWTPPKGITAAPMVDDCGMGVVHVRMELGSNARVVHVPNGKCLLCVQTILNDCAMQLLIEADDPFSSLDGAAETFSRAIAKIEGRT